MIAVTLIGSAMLAFGACANPNIGPEGRVSPGQQWLSAHEEQATPGYKQVAASIGEILLVQEETAGSGIGSLGVEMVFNHEYKKIQKLATPHRIQFFWSLALYLPFKTYVHFSEEFHKIMAADCGKEMTDFLDGIIQSSNKREYDKAIVLRAKQIRRNLDRFQKN